MTALPQAGGGSHSLLGASGFHRWSVCAPSVNLQVQLGLTDGGGKSDYAAEGTAAHYVAEQCLRHDQDAWEWMFEQIDVEGEVYTVDPDMVDNVQLFVDYVRSLPTQQKVSVERGVEIEPTLLDANARPAPFPMHGTTDAIGVGENAKIPGATPTIYVGDFKYGAGIRCEPHDAQLKYYALGYMLEALDAERLASSGCDHWKIVLFLVQPRHDHPDGPVRTHEMTLRDLKAWAYAELLPAVERVQDPRAPYVAGEHCQFCPVRHACPRLATAFADFAESGEPRQLSNEKLAEHLALVKPVRQYIKALDEQAYAQLAAKNSVPGYKLVEKHGNRTWKEGALDELKKHVSEDKLYERSFVTPAKAEKIDGLKEVVQRMAYKPVSGWTVADASDKRDAVEPRSAQNAFANV